MMVAKFEELPRHMHGKHWGNPREHQAG
jgi:hypothetical protein